MKVKTLLLAVVVVLANLGLSTPVGAQTTNPPGVPRKPNIIFILADDLGYGDLSCYGQTKFSTPNIDKLANEGMRFTSFYAGSPVCSPSRAAMMLGKHTGHLNIRGNTANTSLEADDMTAAKLLKNAGYRTCLLGKWGLATTSDQAGVPQKQGFDEFFGYISNTEAHDYYAEHLWRSDPPAEMKQGFEGLVSMEDNVGGKRGRYLPDAFTTWAMRYVSYAKPEPYNRYRPFFLFLSYNIPHANNEEGKRTGNGMQVPTDAPYTGESWPQTEKNKAAMIGRMDADIGKLLAHLKSLKQDENTIVIFSSDNGPHAEGGVDPKFFKSAGPFRGQKRDVTEGGIRVPFIVRWPDRIKPGQVSDFQCAMWDFLPTVAEVANVEAPKGLDGISIFPLLTGQTQTNKHDCLYWEFHEKGFQQAVRAGDWKAIRPQAKEQLELYNLKADPGETNNVAAANAEVLAKLEGFMKRERAESPRWPMKAPPEEAKGKKKGKEKADQ